MKKYQWVIIVLLIAAAVLFAVYWRNYKYTRLPNGAPAGRPLK